MQERLIETGDTLGYVQLETDGVTIIPGESQELTQSRLPSDTLNTSVVEEINPLLSLLQKARDGAISRRAEEIFSQQRKGSPWEKEMTMDEAWKQASEERKRMEMNLPKSDMRDKVSYLIAWAEELESVGYGEALAYTRACLDAGIAVYSQDLLHLKEYEEKLASGKKATSYTKERKEEPKPEIPKDGNEQPDNIIQEKLNNWNDFLGSNPHTKAEEKEAGREFDRYGIIVVLEQISLFGGEVTSEIREYLQFLEKNSSPEAWEKYRFNPKNWPINNTGKKIEMASKKKRGRKRKAVAQQNEQSDDTDALGIEKLGFEINPEDLYE